MGREGHLLVLRNWLETHVNISLHKCYDIAHECRCSFEKASVKMQDKAWLHETASLLLLEKRVLSRNQVCVWVSMVDFSKLRWHSCAMSCHFACQIASVRSVREYARCEDDSSAKRRTQRSGFSPCFKDFLPPSSRSRRSQPHLRNLISTPRRRI